MRHAVIMAGGAGERLWPLSRKSRPKQILKLFGGASLLRQSYERVAGFLKPEQIHVITHQAHMPMVSREVPELPPSNLIGEPAGRDTANAVGLAAAVLAKRDPDAVMGVFTADHVITPASCFQKTAELAYQMAEEHADALVTMGVRPTRPDTNYGYIWCGERISEGVFHVKKFTEKPNAARAMKYVASGEYFWNSGMFAWRTDTILDQLKKHLPQSYDAVTAIADVWDGDDRVATLERIYPTLMKISIDFAVMERAEHVIAIEMACHWVDVGTWPALEWVVQGDADENISAGAEAMHLGTEGCIVVSEEKHLIATIGVSDLVIVHSPDATLICKKRDAKSIKELVENLRARFGEQYL